MRGAGLVVLMALGVGIAGAQTARPDACKTEQLALVTDAKEGAFDGMSHSGTMLVVKNTSAQPCTLSPVAEVRFEDASGTGLKVSVKTENPFRGPRPMGHGPVVLPLTLAAGATVSASMRWVSGEVFDHSVCVDPKKVVLTAGEVTLKGDVVAHLCGASAKAVGASVTRLK